MKYVLGVDVGTQSIKAALFNEKMEVVCKASKEQYVETLKPIWATQKATSWWEIIKENIKKILAESKVDPKDIAAFGCCAHMHGAVPIKLDGTVVDDDVQLYCDKRAGDITEQMQKEATESDYDTAANIPQATWHCIKIKWIMENQPDVYEKADKFLTPKDYVNFKLTGETCIDPSEGSGTYAMNSANDQWSDQLIAKLGIDKCKLPTIKQSYDVVGHISKKAAEETGLSCGTVVVAGGGDMPCLLYAGGMTRYGTVVDITGTGGVICGYTEKPVMDKRIMNLRHPVKGWTPFGNIDSAGGSFRWLRDNLAQHEMDEAKRLGLADYEYLCKLCDETDPGADGLYFFPYMMGERTMGSPNSRGCYIGLSLEKRMGHMVRALLEGVSFEYKRTLDIFEKNNKIDSVFHVGGAAKGDTWNQIKADIFNVPVKTLMVDEGGVLGAVLLAAHAVGIIGDLAEGAESILKVKKIYEPNPATREIYDDMYGVFCEMHDALQPGFRKMAKIRDR